MRLSREEFERLVERALEGIPDEFREKMGNVEVLVADFPLPEHVGEREFAPGVPLFGLYVGYPLLHRPAGWVPLMPDRIYIYQRPIEHYCHTRRDIIVQVRRTVLHEVGHFLGMSEQELGEIEKGWREKDRED